MIAVVLLTTTTVFTLLYLAYKAHTVAYFILNTVIIYFSISVKSMSDHAMRVYEPMSLGNLNHAKRELAMIVSRDTEEMGSVDMVRSTVESVSENFTDGGVVSPIFFLVLFLAALVRFFFKSVSTLDSMVGYMNDKYKLFGRASAKFDDFLNFIPARLSVGVIMIAGVTKGMDYSRIYEAVTKFRFAHASPNSAHSMSAFAGALDITLGGPVSYFGKVKDKPYIGEGKRATSPELIEESVSLFKRSALVAVIAMTVLPVLRGGMM